MRSCARVAINVNKQTGNVCIKYKQSYERYTISFIKMLVNRFYLFFDCLL